MDEDTQRELLILAKQAIVAMSAGRRDEFLIFALRDIIRKIEEKGGKDS